MTTCIRLENIHKSALNKECYLLGITVILNNQNWRQWLWIEVSMTDLQESMKEHVWRGGWSVCLDK